MAKIAPSVLGADFARLGEEIRDADKSGVDLFHLDIMDGHFVPNISFGPAIVKTINGLTDKFLDVHLMLSEPEKYFEPFVEAGADSITFHIEVHPEPAKYAAQLKQMNVEVGLSVNPDTPAKRVLPYLENFDLLLVMSVFPGFGGQSFIESALETVAGAREHIDAHNLKTKVAVDGGVDGDNAAGIVAAGADILVMGSAFFNSNDRVNLTKMVQAL
ncbi:MAG: ribulose-phosphate 3-epimerase [Candidatus Zixiibacteriota bacterium]|nr:MAG: ribulose-phosphate 3-epimerase [candidate division Zixibacteria bacterium]